MNEAEVRDAQLRLLVLSVVPHGMSCTKRQSCHNELDIIVFMLLSVLRS